MQLRVTRGSFVYFLLQNRQEWSKILAHSVILTRNMRCSDVCTHRLCIGT